jgi:hypothetical protein
MSGINGLLGSLRRKRFSREGTRVISLWRGLRRGWAGRSGIWCVVIPGLAGEGAGEIGRGGLGGGAGLKVEEAGEGPAELAIEGDVVAEHEVGLEGIGRGVEGERGADFRRAEGGVLLGDFPIEADFL